MNNWLDNSPHNSSHTSREWPLCRPSNHRSLGQSSAATSLISWQHLLIFRFHSTWQAFSLVFPWTIQLHLSTWHWGGRLGMYSSDIWASSRKPSNHVQEESLSVRLKLLVFNPMPRFTTFDQLHRGSSQQTILILKKITSFSKLVSNYRDVPASLERACEEIFQKEFSLSRQC